MSSDAWPEPHVREMRQNSRAVINLVQHIAKQAGDVPPDKAVRIKITGVRTVKIGKGSSCEIDFELAPKDRWPDRSAFVAGGSDEPSSSAPGPSEPESDDDPWG